MTEGTVCRWRVRRTGLAVAIALGLGSAAGPAAADGEEMRALADRVEQLESLVQSLLDERARNERELRRLEAEGEARLDERVDQRVALAMAEVEEEAEAEGGASHSYRFGGYVKTDLLFSAYSDGDLAPGTIGRDFYVPGTIPVGGEDEGTDLDFHARESRFFLRSDHVLENGTEIGSYIELDFLVTSDGNERVSNSYTPRMRHAFLRTGNWLVGQTWSTFQNVGVLPEALDFIGPAEGTVFERQAMVRYSTGPWQIAIENPETTITPFGGGGRIVTDDGAVPDLVARWEVGGDWGSFAAAGIARRLAFEDADTGIDATETALGLSLSGEFAFGEQDKFQWMLTGGTGLGRYIGVNASNGAAITPDGDLEGIDSLSGYVSYKHYWAPGLRSSLMLSALSVDNDTALTGLDVTRDIHSVHVNLIYSPFPKFDFGVEYLHANREIESGEDGNLDRLQFSAKYAF